MKRAIQPIKGINFMAVKWTLETCKADALKYKSKSEWDKNSPGYQAAYKNKWLDQCCGHMDILWEKKWTLETCKADALKYKSKSEWKKNSNGYNVSLNNKWLKECCSHMDVLIEHGKWTLETCKTDALKYNSRKEWQKNNGGAFQAAHRKGWINECCKHMKTKNSWTLETCKADALKYKTRTEWFKSSPAYKAAFRNGWLVECCGHMDTLIEYGKWTLESCKKDALKYKSRKEWSVFSSKSYASAVKKKWLKECTEHMKHFGGTSTPEQELQNLLKNKNPGLVFENNKKFTILPNQKQELNLPHVFKYELDIYIPNLNLGIEFNGSYWHSFEGLKRGRFSWTDEQIKNYHIHKAKYFNSLGIKVITVNQKDWNTNKKNILKQIDANLNVLKTRYNNCEVLKND